MAPEKLKSLNERIQAIQAVPLGELVLAAFGDTEEQIASSIDTAMTEPQGILVASSWKADGTPKRTQANIMMSFSDKPETDIPTAYLQITTYGLAEARKFRLTNDRGVELLKPWPYGEWNPIIKPRLWRLGKKLGKMTTFQNSRRSFF